MTCLMRMPGSSSVHKAFFNVMWMPCTVAIYSIFYVMVVLPMELFGSNLWGAG